MTEPRRYPSLDVVRGELDARIAEQARGSAAFDARAGLVLGFAGVLIGLAPDDPQLSYLLAQIIAAVAAGVAGYSLTFRVAGAIEPRAIRELYLLHDLEATRLRVLDTRIVLFERDEERFARKVTCLRWAFGLLAISVALMLAGSIFDYIH